MTVRATIPWAASLCLTLLAACGNDVVLNGSDDVIIEAHVRPDTLCRLGTDSPVVPRGTFDIFKAGVKVPIGGVKEEDLPLNHCSTAYELNLRVRNKGDESIVFESAQVTIETSDGEKIVFDAKGAKLPNPFTTRTLAPVHAESTGVVTIRAIPYQYAVQLGTFRNEEIAVRVVLIGREEGGDEIASRPFEFPIQLCFGCLYACFNADLINSGVDPEDLYARDCPDDSGADDRVCIDPDC